jgi:hypothetical protein
LHVRFGFWGKTLKPVIVNGIDFCTRPFVDNKRQRVFAIGRLFGERKGDIGRVKAVLLKVLYQRRRIVFGNARVEISKFILEVLLYLPQYGKYSGGCGRIPAKVL